MRSLPGKTREEETLNVHARLVPYAVTAGAFGLDRLLKEWALQALSGGGSFPVWPGILHWTLVHNTGAAFGLWPDGADLLTVFSAASALLILGYLRRPVPNAIAWSLVASGALGNLYDRLRFGYVVDFIDLRVWPVFNFADSCICVGVAWIVWRAFWPRPVRTA